MNDVANDVNEMMNFNDTGTVEAGNESTDSNNTNTGEEGQNHGEGVGDNNGQLSAEGNAQDGQSSQTVPGEGNVQATPVVQESSQEQIQQLRQQQHEEWRKGFQSEAKGFFTEKDAEHFDSDQIGIMQRLIAAGQEALYMRTMNDISNAAPQLVQNMVKGTLQSTESTNKFFKAYPELNDGKYSQAIANNIKILKQADPNISYEDVTKRAAMSVAQLYGITLASENNVNVNAQANNSPASRNTGSALPGQNNTSQDTRSEEQKDLDEMFAFAEGT